MEITFRQAEDSKTRDNLAKFLLKRPLKYGGYGDWVGRVREELKIGYKDSMLAFCNGMLIGDLISQPSKDFPKFLCELKNARIHEDFQRGYVLNFMIRQREIKAMREGYKAMICDTRSDNLPILGLLTNVGYRKLLSVPLYDENVEDIVMIKPLGDLEKGFLVPIKNKIISGLA